MSPGDCTELGFSLGPAFWEAEMWLSGDDHLLGAFSLEILPLVWKIQFIFLFLLLFLVSYSVREDKQKYRTGGCF